MAFQGPLLHSLYVQGPKTISFCITSKQNPRGAQSSVEEGCPPPDYCQEGGKRDPWATNWLRMRESADFFGFQAI